MDKDNFLTELKGRLPTHFVVAENQPPTCPKHVKLESTDVSSPVSGKGGLFEQILESTGCKKVARQTADGSFVIHFA